MHHEGARARQGGVSPRLVRRRVAAAAEGDLSDYSDFRYNGGPVIGMPEVYTTFWGPSWSDSAHAARAARLNLFIQDLLDSEYMNVLSQYGVGAGAGSAGRFVASGSVPVVPVELDEAGIAGVIQSQIDAGVLPEPPASGNNIALIIYLDETISANIDGLRMCGPANDNAFGLHFSFRTTAGNEFFYALIPALHDECIRNTCGGGGCSLGLDQTQEERLTQVTSHDFAEMCTDPRFQQGWYGTQSDENGDICNGQRATITVGTRTWSVQKQYSKTDDENTGGVNVCVTGAPVSMAKRADGPA